MEKLPVPGSELYKAEILRLATDFKRANGPVMSLVNRLGGSFERQLSLIPQAYRNQIETAVERGLNASLSLASQADRLPDAGSKGRLAAAVAAGAAGGAGGIATAVAELPLTITLILNAIRSEARQAGFDPNDPAIRLECIRTFGAGSPLQSDDGINTSFLSARLTLTGPAVQKVIAAVAPRLATAFGQKLAAQAVPILGALTGAGLNAAFLNYYREIARIRFALLRLTQRHGEERVLADFSKAVEKSDLKRA